MAFLLPLDIDGQWCKYESNKLAIGHLKNERNKMSDMLAQANFSGKLPLGGIEIPCFVLNDKRRMISGRGLTTAIGMKGRGQGTARITSHPALKSFIDDNLALAIANPQVFLVGGLRTSGYEATVLHSLCESILRARDAGALKSDYEIRYAAAAEAMIRAFAKVGIVALIDEATGYQEQRDKDELTKLLSIYLTEERLSWAKKFPDSFYKEIYRLNNWNWPPIGSHRPQLIGKYTIDIVYERLPDGVLENLKTLNPADEITKRRKYRHHQFFSADIGQPDLKNHIIQLMTLMRAASSWKEFKRLLDRAIPKGGSFQLDMTKDIE